MLVKATIPDTAGIAGLPALCRWHGDSVGVVRVAGHPTVRARDGSLAAGLLAGALFAAEFACLFAGLQYTTASRLTVFVHTSPLWVAAIVPLMVRSERLRPVQWAGVVLAFVAIVFALRESFVASAAGRDAALMWRGDLLALIAGALWGLTTVVIRTTG